MFLNRGTDRKKINAMMMKECLGNYKPLGYYTVTTTLDYGYSNTLELIQESKSNINTFDDSVNEDETSKGYTTSP
ncbi:12181_t:CDS:2, partial [Dentiscutata erythropus]